MDTFRVLSFPQVFRAAAAWLKTPAGGVAVLIFATFLARLLFASDLTGYDQAPFYWVFYWSLVSLFQFYLIWIFLPERFQNVKILLEIFKRLARQIANL